MAVNTRAAGSTLTLQRVVNIPSLLRYQSFQFARGDEALGQILQQVCG